MNNKNLLKNSLITLIVIALAIISFGGIFVTEKNNVKNLLPKYFLAKDIKGYRMLEFGIKEETTISTNEEGEQSQEQTNSYTIDDYKKSKEILENRISKMGITDYNIRNNLENGNLVIELPEYNDMDSIINELTYKGKFEILDDATNEVLMDNSDLDKAEVGYGTDNSGNTAVYFSFIFNESGKEKFKNITNTYRHVEETTVETENTENTENTEATEETHEDKKVKITFDDETIFSSHFEQEISNGVLQLNLGTSSNYSIEELQERAAEASKLSMALNLGKIPVDLEVKKDVYIESDFIQVKINIIIYTVLALVCLSMIYMLFKYKLNGYKANVALVGFISILLIAVRVFNVEISISGIFAFILSIGIEIVILINILKDIKGGIDVKIALLNNIKKYMIVLAPAFIISVIFTLMNLSFGMVFFWGLFISVLYNVSLTRVLLVDKK